MSFSDNDAGEASQAPSIARTATSVLVRVLGICLLVAGLVLAALVMREIWALYQSPERIEAFAEAVERGSNIDKTLAPRRSGDSLSDLSIGTATEPGEASIRLSYFFAWFIVFVLMLLLSRIAIAAVSTGGKLALYDLEVKRLARAIVEETAKAYR